MSERRVKPGHFFLVLAAASLLSGCFTAYVECGFVREDVCKSLRLASVSPVEGSSAGGTLLTLTGEAFDTSLEVYLGEAQCTSVTIQSQTTATCLTPQGTAGEKRTVLVRNASGVTSSLENAFSYLPRNSWTATSTTNAPQARQGHSAIWTGSRMIIFGGGRGSGDNFNSGGLYDPGNDSWNSTSTTNAPEARSSHTAVWTGNKMIVFGGQGNNGKLDSGGLYDPSNDSWTSTSTTNGPVPRANHSAVWTGNKMIVFGGQGGLGGNLHTGGVYNPSNDSWTSTATSNAPEARGSHTAVWTGSKMIVFGGTNNGANNNTGGLYDPSNDSWTSTSTTSAPEARSSHTAVWTGSKMIVFGGFATGGTTLLDSGGLYDPANNSWTSTSTTSAPVARQIHTAIWTGSKMIVFGGVAGENAHFNSGGLLIP